MKKLTYCQICKLIKSGREDEIPSDYNIIWANPKPQKLFDVEVPGERITVNGNDFPSPTKAYVSGEYEIIIPGDIISTSTPLEFGNVVLSTNLILSKLKFEYEESHIIDHWMCDKFVNGTTIKKSDYVFNISLIIGDTKLTKINVFNAWPRGLNNNIADIEYDWVELICDYK